MKPHIPRIGETVADRRRELVGVVLSIGPVRIVCRTPEGQVWYARPEHLVHPGIYAMRRAKR